MEPIEPIRDTTVRHEQLIPVSAAARLRGLTARRLRRAIRTGALDAFSIGGWLRVRLEDVDAWLAQQRYVPCAERARQAGEAP